MSKYMQLTINVRPYCKENLRAVYPKIASSLSHLNEAIVKEDPSIFDLVGKLDKLLYASDGNPALKDILLKHQNTLSNLHEKGQGFIVD